MNSLAFLNLMREQLGEHPPPTFRHLHLQPADDGTWMIVADPPQDASFLCPDGDDGADMRVLATGIPDESTAEFFYTAISDWPATVDMLDRIRQAARAAFDLLDEPQRQQIRAQVAGGTVDELDGTAATLGAALDQLLGDLDAAREVRNEDDGLGL